MRLQLSYKVVACFIVAAMVFFAVPETAHADVPHLIQYQGRLTNAAGAPLDTIVEMTFTIFADSAGTSALWTETHDSVIVTDGLFDALLGSSTPLDATDFTGATLWMGIALGEGDIMTPLTPIISTAFSIRSQNADHATTARRADTATVALNAAANGWVDAGNEVYLSTLTDSVGIGATNPRAPLEVQGPVGHAIIGESHGSGTAAGVLGTNDSNGFGLMGVSTNGRGVTGLSTNGFGGHFYGPKNYFSGKLGIGTENPGTMLHLYTDESGGSNYVMIQSSHATNWGATGLIFQTPQNTWHFRMDDDNNNDIPDGAIGLRSVNHGEVMTWTENGRVGIGTNEPNYILESVSPNTAFRARCTGSGIGVYASSASGFGLYSDATKNFFGGLTGFGTTSPTHRVTVNGELALQKNGVTKFHMNYYNTGFNICETTVADYRLYIKEGGNVGIGTSNPQTKFHVNGDAFVEGTFYADAFETDAIGKANIIDEPGVASASSSTTVDLTTSWAPYLSRQITVPTAGYILAVGCAHVILDHGAAGSSEGMIAFSNVTNSNNGGMPQRFRLSTDVAAGTFWASIPCQRVFTVSAAGTYTYYLVGLRDSGNPAEIMYLQMTLLFIPTSYASKDGDITASPEDNVFVSDITPDLNAELASAAQTDVSPAISSADGDNGDLLKYIKALTAEIESLKSRMQTLEGK